MLRLKKESIEEIKRQAREGYPLECGGFLAGPVPIRYRASSPQADGKEITAVYPMKNLNSHQPRIRFEIDPKEFQRLEAEATKDGLQLLVFYHTHPDSPLKTNPSAFDRERAEGLSTFWPDLSYLIVSVDKGKEFQLASWVFNPAQGGFEKEEIEVV
ncbi:MAG TPA: Mov34/MPN/PAD-1 family protein [Candidatus Tripitaka sp. YC43]